MKIILLQSLTQKTFIHDFDLKNETLYDIRQWLQSSVRQPLPFNRYKFVQRYPPYYRFDAVEQESVTLNSLNIKSNKDSLLLIKDNKNSNKYNIYEYVIKFILLKICVLLNIVWDYVKFIDREKMDYILIDSNNIEHVPSSNNENNNKPNKYVITNNNNNNNNLMC